MTIADQLRQTTDCETLQGSLNTVLNHIINMVQTKKPTTFTCGIWETGTYKPYIGSKAWDFMCSECYVQDVYKFFQGHGFNVGRNYGISKRDHLVISL